MLARFAVLGVVLLLAGCTDTDEPAVESASAGAALVAAPVDGAAPMADGGLLVPILLEGSTATQISVCVTPAPPCKYQGVVPGTSDLMIEDVVGRVTAGKITLTWEATSPATEELAAGIMLMGGEGDACAPMNLGSLRGPSPLTIEVTASERAVCPGEVLHAWASNGIYVGQDPVVSQLDVDQAFRLEGSVTLTP